MIRVEGLSKAFRVDKRREGLRGALRDLFRREQTEVRAVDSVTFSVAQGEMIGLIGPNGAGKSTTLKILTGILVPSAGLVEVNGLVPWKDRIRHVAGIGAVFGQRSSLWWDLPVGDSLRLLAEIYGVPPDRYRNRMAELDRRLQISKYMLVPVRKLSLGERMRCDLAAALLHEPKVLFLDEPTIGLDVVAKAAMRGFLKEANRDLGATVILTTHDLADIEELCTRILLIDKGRLLYDGPLEALRRRHDVQARLRLEFSRPVSHAELLAAFDGPGVAWEDQGGSRWEAAVDRRRTQPVDLTRALLGSLPVADLALAPTPIEEVVRRIYAEGAGDAKG